MQNKKFEIYCRGRIPSTGYRCHYFMNATDGEFLFVGKDNDIILNSHLDAQKLQCPKCGFELQWRRSEKFKKGKR